MTYHYHDGDTFERGGLELELTRADAASASHPGPCDSDVEALMRKPYVAKQLAAMGKREARETVRDMFADATPAELADHQRNLERILWIAACDIREGVV